MTTRTDVETALLVLGKIATADQWAAKPDAAMAATWAECFAVHDLSRRDLLEAVVVLFADDQRPRDRILPADVIRPARKIRRERAEREKVDGTRDREALSAARRAMDECPVCDPNGWTEADAGLVRCDHGRALGGRDRQVGES